ncbi:MAG TPA: DUF1152 domain-containing protein [Candidatus Nanoarchaeia archaeon]|nr:DUF1152 domain-containing protein [Candidatus Nanoarchaeia archaeon]
MNLTIPYQKPLIIGTGGGNDIVSATLVVAHLREQSIPADLAGVCSPGAWHRYAGKEEQPINRVTKDTNRYRPSLNPVPFSSLDAFIDAHLPEALQQEHLPTSVYNLSFRCGTEPLVESLSELCKNEGYDGLVLVDVGGDILARGKKDPTILSPLMDFSTLYVASQADVPSVLFEFGLQTDGELRPAGCREILQELSEQHVLLSTTELSLEDAAVQQFLRVYDTIKHLRHGHTAEMTLQTLLAKEDIHTTYRARVQVLDRKWFFSYEVTLEAPYFGKGFLFDVPALAARRELAFSYRTPLELYLRTKKTVDTKSEMDGLYARVDDVCVWLGLLCPQLPDAERKEAIAYGLENLPEHAHVALVWKKDAPKNISGFAVDDFVVLGEKEKARRVAREVEIILDGERGEP